MRTRSGVPYAAVVAISAAAAELALLALATTGRLVPTVRPDDGPWLAIWLGYGVAAALVLERRPRSLVGAVLLAIGVLPSLAVVIELIDGPARLGMAAYAALPPLLLVALPAAFPDGVGGSRLRTVGLVLAGLVAGVGMGGVLIVGQEFQLVALASSVLLGVACLLAQGRSAVRAPEPIRSQRRIFVWGFGATALVMLTGAIATAVATNGAGDGAWLQMVGMWCIPAAIIVAMLAGGLWGTDLVRGRQAAHAGIVGLSGVVVAALVAAVASLAPTPLMAALGAIAGATLAAPLFWWGRRRVRTRLFGPGDVDVTKVLGEAGEPELADMVAAALRSPSARITTHPHSSSGALVRPLGNGRHLVVEPRRAGESFTTRDERAADRMAQLLASMLRRRDLENELASAEAALARHREREQRRLRAALHDDVGPLLVGAEMQAKALNDSLTRSAMQEDAGALYASLTEARRALRTVLDEGSPRALGAGLEPALTGLCGRWVDPDVILTTRLRGDVTSETAGAVYHLVAECLANVTQHARASACAVDVSAVGDQVVVTVEDDGAGFDPSRPRGIGLASMRGRALELGGDVEIVHLTRGTRVVGRFPAGHRGQAS